MEKETIREEGEEGGAKPEETTVAATDSQPSPSAPAVAPVSLEAPDFTPTEPGTTLPTEAPEDGDKLAWEVPGEEDQPDSATAGPKSHEEGRGGAEEGETHTKPAGELETHPQEHADEEGREGEGLPDPTEPFEHLHAPDSPDTVTSDRGEHKTDPAQDHDKELQHPEGSEEAAEALPRPEEREPGMSSSEEGAHHSQELEVPEHPDMEQQAYTK